MARRKNNQDQRTILPQKRKKVVARSPNQKEVLRNIKENDLTFCAGPAGSGKTHLSVGAAIALNISLYIWAVMELPFKF